MRLPIVVGRILSRLAAVAPGGYTLRPWLHRLRGVRIGKNVWISQNVYLDELHPEAISIGDNCTIGLRTSIFSHFYWGPRRNQSNGQVTIGKDVFVGPHCVILPRVAIGEGSVIKAGTVLSHNVPPHTFWGARSPEFLGWVDVPLTPENDYEKFLRGVRPAARRRIDPGQVSVEPAPRRENGV